MNGRTITTTGLVVAVSLFLSGCITVLPFGASPRGPYMHLETLLPAQKLWTADKVLLIGLDGILTNDPVDGPGFLSETSVLLTLKDALLRAERDRTIRSVLLRVNSPGGGVTASDLIYTELMRFKKRTGKKIVVVCMDTTASGAYYAAMAADRVVAHPTSVIGSIGVVAIFPSLQELTRKIGVSVRIVKSGEMKDMGSMWRDLEPEEREVFQKLINSLYERFLDIVAEGRPGISKAKLRELADGRIYSAQEALDLGLVDAIGYIEDAFETAKAIASLPDASLVEYSYRYGYHGNYYASASPEARAPHSGADPAAHAASGPPTTQINLLNLDLSRYPATFRGPFYYLWAP